MPKSCCAINCQERCSKLSTLSFHQFPYSNVVLLSKWIQAIKRKNFVPKKNSHFVCSKHFEESCFEVSHVYDKTASSYNERQTPKRRKIGKLKFDAVPTVFEGLYKYMQPSSTTPRRILKRTKASSSSPSPRLQGVSESDTDSAPETSSMLHDKAVQVNRCCCRSRCTQNGKLLRNRTQRLRRSLQRTKTMKLVLQNLVGKQKLSTEAYSLLKSSFTGLTLDILKNQQKNCGRAAKGRRYDDAVVKFAVALHFLSPTA